MEDIMATQSAASLPLNARSFHAFATQLVQAGNIGVIPVGTPFGEFGPMGTTPQPISSLNLPDPHLPYTRKGAPERIASTSAGHREVDAARNFLQYHVDEAVSAAERIMGNVPLRTSASQFFAEGSRKFSEGDYRDGYIDSLHSAAVFLRLGELSDVINARSALEFSRASLRRIALDFPAAAILAECQEEVTEQILRKLG